MNYGDALSLLKAEIEKARMRLAIARALALVLPILLIAGAWGALWMTGLPDQAPGLARTLAVIAVLAGLGYLAFRAARRWRMPSAQEARARLAIDSKLEPGAFEALDDLPAKLDPLSVAMWRREQERAAQQAAEVRAAPLSFDFRRADPFRLRFGVAIALVIAALIGGAEAPDRFFRAFLPDPGPLVGDGPLEIEAWVTPASYTRAAPISLSDRLSQRIETPPSVEATVRVTGPVEPPRLIFEGRGGKRVIRFSRAADGAYEARLQIPDAGRLRVVRFLTRATWRIAPAADAAPTAAFAGDPTIGEDDTVNFGWRAGDDFGVRSMALRVTPVEPPPGLRNAPPVDTEFESPPGDPREAEAQATLDLSRHPYAGMEVEARIVAFDALGQAGVSEPVRITLPEKVFLQPLAQAAIEIRRMILWERRPYEPRRAAPGGPAFFEAFEPLFGTLKMVLRTDDQDPRLERAPQAIRRAGRFLDSVTMNPQDGYFRDQAVFLGFRMARSELNAARDIGETNKAADTLWRTALRAEYGGAADARRALEMAQQALADALANGASPERVRQLMQALRQATENYMQALIQEAMREGQTPETQEDTEEQTSLSQRDINELMREVERLSQEGRIEEAQALLQQLANLLENLDVRLTQGGEQGEQGEGQQEGDQGLQQSMEQLSDAMGEQRALNDDTRQEESGEPQQGQGEEGEQGGEGGQSLAQRQNDIRQGLGQARQQAAENGAQSGALDNAEAAMRRSEEALRQGNYEDARAAQEEAMRALRRGANELAAEMRRRGEGGEQGAEGERDPLGRTTTGAGAGDGDTSVPTQSDRVRAREILDDIRRRAQDPNRPEAEREYLRRLLDRFANS